MTGEHVLVVGECLIDVVREPGGRLTEVVGGSPANVALGLARQDVAVRLLTALGRDVHGERAAAHLRASGVEIEESSWSLAATSMAQAQILDDGSADYVFDVTWTLSEDVLPAADLIHVGSISAFLDPGATALEAALDRRERTALVTFDPNIRPALVGEHDGAVTRFERLAARADLIKLSDEDAAWLYPGVPLAQVCDRLVGLGPRVVALTRGGTGALLCAAGLVVDVRAPTVSVRDTVGAGDTFMAALVREALWMPELLRAPDTATLRAAGEYAVAAAALTVQRVGADLPTAAEIRTAMSAPARVLRPESVLRGRRATTAAHSLEAVGQAPAERKTT